MKITVFLIIIVLTSKISSFRDSPYCDSTHCSADQTCCTNDDGSASCCKFKNATCCGLGGTCCPHGDSCDPPTQQCVDFENTTYCSYCEMVVGYFIDYGCDAACGALPPPVDLICEGLVELGVCQDIIDWIDKGLSDQAVCGIIGFCSSGTCNCGYCTKYVTGRCLSFPNHCPPSNPFKNGPNLPIVKQKYKRDIGQVPCLDGECGSDSLGCCLTCY